MSGKGVEMGMEVGGKGVAVGVEVGGKGVEVGVDGVGVGGEVAGHRPVTNHTTSISRPPATMTATRLPMCLAIQDSNGGRTGLPQFG